MSLKAQNIGVRFRGVIALDGVDVEVGPGQILAVVGPNGSGKSTLFNAITGFVPLYSGTVTVNGIDISTKPADSRIRTGVARTFQTPRIDPDLKMIDSVMCGFLPSLRSALIPSLLGLPGIGAGERRARKAAMELLEMFGLADQAQVPMGQLPLGSVRMADVLRAMAMRPHYLLLDEPAAGLSHVEQKLLTDGIKTIASDGVGVLLVEHNFPLVRGVADKLVVFENGRLLASGDPERVASEPAVVEAYLGAGTEHQAFTQERAPSTGDELLQVHDFGVSYGRAQVCHGVNLGVRPSEINAVLGPNGAGKSSLMLSLAGIATENRHWGGSVTLDKQEITRFAAEVRSSVGLAFVPERRGNLFSTMTVEENLQLALRVLPPEERQSSLDAVLQLFPVIRRLLGTQSGLLSGGEQQMVAIGMALCARPRVLLLDEPTQGLAPTILDDMVNTFLSLRNEGLAIVLTEQNQGFAAALADRFVVLAHGEIQTTGDRADLRDREAIADAYL